MPFLIKKEPINLKFDYTPFFVYPYLMDIKETPINYQKELTYESRLCKIGHINPHYHPHDLELIFCLSGSVRLTAGHQSVRIQAGEIFSVDYRDIHYIHSDCDNLTLVFHLNLTRTHLPWENLRHVFFACESCHCYPYQKEAMNEVKDILLALSYVQHTAGPTYPQGICEPANRLIEILFKFFNWFNYENQDEYMNLDLHDRFYRVLAYCNDHFDQKISVSQLAASEHISRNYFSQFISKTVFKSFSLMVKYIRCFEAEHLLLTTDLPNSEISYRSGFSDPKYFYTTFKEWWGCTPTEHRDRCRAYLEQAPRLTVVKEAEAATLLKEYITDWHLQKVFV